MRRSAAVLRPLLPVLRHRYEEAADRLAAHGEPGAAPGAARADAADLDGLLARIAAARGRTAEAAARAARAVRAAAGTDSPEIRAVAELDLADVLRWSGRPEESGAAADRAGRLYAAKGHLPGARRAAEFTATRVDRTAARTTAPTTAWASARATGAAARTTTRPAAVPREEDR